MSTDGKNDPIALGDYINRNVINEIRRVPGVGQAQVFGTERAMRIWLDPDRMVGLSITPNDVTQAIQGQNAQVAAGTLGDLPNLSTQPISIGVVVTGQLSTPEQFADIVLRANEDGFVGPARRRGAGRARRPVLRLVGPPERPAVGRVRSPALPHRQRSRHRRGGRGQALGAAQVLPAGVEYVIAVDSSKLIPIPIQGVLETLVEAVVLVFLVMFLFLQNLRATLIPTIVVPVALMGALAPLYAFGFSINVLTMFGLVLAIGIVVDDAIVVVENVERIMAEEGSRPARRPTRRWGDISGAIVGITLVLVSVFVPMAFFGGSVGKIYQQFSLAMVSSILCSALLASSLTPALCASLLQPLPPRPPPADGSPRRFDRWFGSLTVRYQGVVGGR